MAVHDSPSPSRQAYDNSLAFEFHLRRSLEPEPPLLTTHRRLERSGNHQTALLIGHDRCV
jgi:hypothetical protein